MTEDQCCIVKLDPTIRTTCARSGEPLNLDRRWVVSIGATGYLSPEAAWQASPALFTMLSAFYLTGLSDLTDIKGRMDLLRGVAL